MNTTLRILICLVICLFNNELLSLPLPADRGEELKKEMWNASDKDFNVVKIPEKWSGKSAVIIAKLHQFEYRRAAAVIILKINQYSHFRIKLIDKNAVNEYTEISFRSSDSKEEQIYVGFKVVKPDGKEIIVDQKTAVKMERNGSGQRYSYKKIAIPNLEPGDIIDYYICSEESRMAQTEIEFFEPVIYNLPQDYPVIKQKLQFKVQRRCFINLRSVNGAPELKLVTDDGNDEQYYSLEDGDREGLADVKWLYPNRDVPTIKFRAAYANRHGMRTFDVLLGEPGEVKNKVKPEELAEVTRTIMLSASGGLSVSNNANKYLKKKYTGPKDNFEVAKAAYYYNRHELLNGNETRLLQDETPYSASEIGFLNGFSAFLKDEEIPHDIVVTSAREISSIDDVIFENELEYLVRVRKGNEYMYFAPYSMYTLPGTVPSSLQGADGFAFDGLVKSSKWEPVRITLPVTGKDQNISSSNMTVRLSADLQSTEMSVQRTVAGSDKSYSQYRLIDVYDAIAEDNKSFDPYEYEYPSKQKKQYAALQKAYQDKRETVKANALKELLESDYEFKLKDPANLLITQTGRRDQSPAIIYSFMFKTDELVKKTGSNYIMDIGKLIEGQTSIESEALQRDQNIYFPNARSFRYNIILEIPEGYQVQGLEKFNTCVENVNGGFTSTAKEVNGKVIIDTYKHYDVSYAPKSEWAKIVAFINAAHNFTEQKILLKKK